ncbi:glycosyltransferase [Frateuria hangzhouensis]|uniref:glycosyltransferase n=1 Tax=Frateuria hangzhouensis TaxID=2995589 RepID=UPI002260BA25|nr:glycosyltransferase [Frateuria sp. STR12]MCX7515316.1 glycosyltransferase [Frateuria sp. STR12]
MIFVSVGTQLPFDRLISAIDNWAAVHPDMEIFGQIGRCTYVPRSFKSAPFLNAKEIDFLYGRAALVVGHAGMGTILGALTHSKPIIVMPRIAQNGEHRNEHQTATIRRLESIKGVHIAREQADLFRMLDAFKERGLEGGELSGSAPPAFIWAIRELLVDDA